MDFDLSKLQIDLKLKNSPSVNESKEGSKQTKKSVDCNKKSIEAENNQKNIGREGTEEPKQPNNPNKQGVTFLSE